MACWPERFERVDAFAVHDVAHHASSHSAHVHFRKLQCRRVARHHHAKHFGKDVLVDLGLALFLNDIQPPEGKENGYFFARGSSTVGQHEGGQGFVEVVAEHDESLPSRGGSAGVAVADCGATAGVPLVTQTQ